MIPLFPAEPPSRRRHKKQLPASTAGPGRLVKAGRGGTRIFLEGLWLLRSGFEAFGEATVLLDEDRRRVTLLLDPEVAQALGSSEKTQVVQKKISGKVKRGKKIPVIDIERQDLRSVLGGATELVVQSRRGQLVITPSEAQALREERLRAAPNNYEVSLYAGAGLLSVAAEQAGARPVLAVENWEQAAEAFWEVHRKRVPVLELGVEKVALGEVQDPGRFDLPRNPWLLTAGVPCETYSKLGGKGLSAYDPHQLSDQIYWTLVMILRTNPLNVVVENVPSFLKHAGGFVRALQVLGYHVHVEKVDPSRHGYAARRERAVIVATTEPGFSFPRERSRPRRGERVRDLLLDPESSLLYELGEREGGWFSIRAKRGLGKSLKGWIGRKKFPATILEYDADRAPAVTKSMFKGNPTGPYVHHPRKRDLYRLLTLGEIERLHGIPASVAARLREAAEGKYALASQFYGQGVHLPLFREIIQRLPGSGRALSSGNPAPVVPLYYGPGPLYSVLPWGWIR